MAAEDGSRRELAVRTVVAIGAGTAGVVDPVLGGVVTGLGPALEMGLSRVTESLRRGRTEHAAETLLDAAEAAGAESDEGFLEFVEQAVSDEGKQELLARALLIAQDTASRDKRRALGRAIASGVADDGVLVDQEQLFVRVLDDLDMPHVRLLRLMTTVPEHYALRGEDVRAWRKWSIAEADPGLGDVADVLMNTLERHQLVQSELRKDKYRLTGYGEWFVERLAEPGPAREDSPNDRVSS